MFAHFLLLVSTCASAWCPLYLSKPFSSLSNVLFGCSVLIIVWLPVQGELHCVGCCPEAPFVFAFGGGSQEPRVWDIRESAAGMEDKGIVGCMQSTLLALLQ